ncbi:MAG: dihydrodipicolinate synthase family protein, partial [Rhodothermales bacterium]
MADFPRISGLYTAPVTPVDDDGRVDAPRLRELIDFLLDGGTKGFCFGGGTSEYPYFELSERKRYLETASDHVGDRAPYVVSVGAPTVRGVIELGEHAIEHGAQALLIPMPYFYRYDQHDLVAYVRYVTAHLDHPCLLYNLARFTNPLEPQTALRLLREIPHLIGIKDSSLDKAAMQTYADAKPSDAWSLICGGDHLIFQALEAGWDGTISGTACACPELVAILVYRHRSGNTAGARVASWCSSVGVRAG